MQKNNSFVRGIIKIEKFLQIIAQVFVLILMLITVANIVGRFLGFPMVGAIELSLLLLVFIVFLGLAYTQYQNGHVRVEIVVDWLSGGTREVVEIIALIISLAILCVMLWQTGLEGFTAFQVKTYQPGLISFPTWPGKLIIPIGLLFFVIQVIIQILERLSKFKSASVSESKLAEVEK
jgi:TRAP-type C4-dicarboxylate transport system permease small subunit